MALWGSHQIKQIVIVANAATHYEVIIHFKMNTGLRRYHEMPF